MASRRSAPAARARRSPLAARAVAAVGVDHHAVMLGLPRIHTCPDGWATTTSVSLSYLCPADDHAGVSLHSDHSLSQLAVESSRDAGRPISFSHQGAEP